MRQQSKFLTKKLASNWGPNGLRYLGPALSAKVVRVNVNIPLAAAAHVMVIFVIPRMHGHTKQEKKRT